MPKIHNTLEKVFDWLIENVRPFSYLLPTPSNSHSTYASSFTSQHNLDNKPHDR